MTKPSGGRRYTRRAPVPTAAPDLGTSSVNPRASHVLSFLAAALALCCPAARAQLPPAYPSSDVQLVSAARSEGKVVVYAATDLAAAAPLIRDFESIYPGVRVVYTELNSSELYARYVDEVAAHRPSADVLWSSAMDLQMKLANDNLAAAYRSPEAAALPAWAVWRDTAYGTTFEPAVFVYNTRLVTGAEIPRTHADFQRLLETRRDKYVGRVTSYDIEKSAVGKLFATQDSRTRPAFWNFARVLGANSVELESDTSVMMERIASGKAYLGYNLIGSYALTRARRDPSIGVVLPSDYTLVMSRIALISRAAPHPNAARLWLDYLLSRRGQTVLARRSELSSIRGDVEGEFTAAALQRQLGASLQPIRVDPTLLVYLDRAKQADFLHRWHQAIGPPN